MSKVDLISLHNQLFTDHGFQLNKKFHYYEKSFDLGSQVIFIHYTEYPESNILEYNLGVRIDQVEQMIHQFLPSLKDYSDRSITLIQTLNKIGKELPKRFSIANDWELSEAIMKVESFFVSTGFNWLNDMMDPIKLNRAFLEQKNNSFKTQNFIYNTFRATAISRIFNPSDHPVVRERFLNQIHESNKTPFSIASYLQFLDFLDQI